MVHLDISLHNFLTDHRGRCACIDYQLSWRVDDLAARETYWQKGTEVPPELECGQACNPYMIDVWALAVLILRACKVCMNGLFVFYRQLRSALGRQSVHSRTSAPYKTNA